MSDVLIKLPDEGDVETFKSEEHFNALVSKIETVIADHVYDLETEKGRKAIASLAHKVVKTKTSLVKIGKSISDDLKAQAKEVTDASTRITTKLDELRDLARKPLTDWEEVEKKRKMAHESVLDQMHALKHFSRDSTAEQLEGSKEKLAELSGRDWEEYEEKARSIYSEVSQALNAAILDYKQRAAERAELERLRAELAEKQGDEQEAPKPVPEEATQEEQQPATGKPLPPKAPQPKARTAPSRKQLFAQAVKELSEATGICESDCEDIVQTIADGKTPSLAALL